MTQRVYKVKYWYRPRGGSAFTKGMLLVRAPNLVEAARRGTQVAKKDCHADDDIFVRLTAVKSQGIIC